MSSSGLIAVIEDLRKKLRARLLLRSGEDLYCEIGPFVDREKQVLLVSILSGCTNDPTKMVTGDAAYIDSGEIVGIVVLGTKQ